MQLRDAHTLQEPTAGVLTMQSVPEEKGYKAGYEWVRRLMRLANIRPIYPRNHLTQFGERPDSIYKTSKVVLSNRGIII